MTSFLAFAQLCATVEAVSGSLEKIDLVAAFLAGLDEAELSIASCFVMGTVFSPGLDLDLGVGPSILYEALARACGCPAGQISDMLRTTGDPGLVAAGIVEKRRPLGFAAFLDSEALSITDVYERFLAIARASGKRSQDSKIKNLQFLFSQAGPLEALYIARLAIEDMRIGVGEGGVRDAVARAFAGKGADSASVERGYNLTNDMGLVAVSARRGTLSELSVMINHPIKMMLAQLGESIAAAIGESGTAAIEWKYDGARVQIHKDGEKVRVFFGVGGPNIGANFHIIGEIFDRVYSGSPNTYTANEETWYVPPGSVSTFELTLDEPGSYTLVDHALYRVLKGAVGVLHVSGDWNPDIYMPEAADASH